jgi:curli biogenesis system outer membrane secretion channel CsgG
MKKLFYAALACALVVAAPTPGLAQAKIRIAIWDFENHAENHWWFYNDLGPAARNQIDTQMSENPKLSSLFTVVERDKLAMVMKEQGLAATGAVDPQTAAKVGKILGVKYVLTGGIDKFSINTTKGGFGGIGGNMTTAGATINMRFIDTSTAERVIAVSADGEVKKGGGFVNGASLSREAEWGVASEAIQKSAKAVVDKLITGEYLSRLSSAAGSGGGIDVRVIKVDGTKAYINVGSSSGIKVGDKFRIFETGAELVDPVTGAKLGAEEKQTGTGVVSEVQEKFAIMTITGTASAKSVVKK